MMVIIQRHNQLFLNTSSKTVASWLLIPGRKLLSLSLTRGLTHDSSTQCSSVGSVSVFFWQNDLSQISHPGSPHLITACSFTLLISLVICALSSFVRAHVYVCVSTCGGGDLQGGGVGWWCWWCIRCGYWISSTKRCGARGLPIKAFQREAWPPATLILPRSALQ